MSKQLLNAQQTKKEFVQSIHNWLMRTLDDRGRSEYKDCFTIEGSSIMCELPQCYFSQFDIPAGTKIEMKFISKKS